MTTGDDERTAYLDRILVGGRERRPVVIADPDPAWPARFEEHRARIAGVLGPLALRIEHIGSTSVPGLAAKPIIDVLVAVDDVTSVDAPAPRDRLAAAGYELRVDEPGHRMFRTAHRDVHLHVWPAAGDDVRRHLLFRDHLRTSASDRARYEEVKRRLATRQWDDMNDYADAKSPVIAEITARAEAWARETHWTP
jgi:GrpB-like predicted nucleotidyltransferase (UPF0157 family)